MDRCQLINLGLYESSAYEARQTLDREASGQTTQKMPEVILEILRPAVEGSR